MNSSQNIDKFVKVRNQLNEKDRSGKISGYTFLLLQVLHIFI